MRQTFLFLVLYCITISAYSQEWTWIEIHYKNNWFFKSGLQKDIQKLVHRINDETPNYYIVHHSKFSTPFDCQKNMFEYAYRSNNLSNQMIGINPRAYLVTHIHKNLISSQFQHPSSDYIILGYMPSLDFDDQLQSLGILAPFDQSLYQKAYYEYLQLVLSWLDIRLQGKFTVDFEAQHSQIFFQSLALFQEILENKPYQISTKYSYLNYMKSVEELLKQFQDLVHQHGIFINPSQFLKIKGIFCYIVDGYLDETKPYAVSVIHLLSENAATIWGSFAKNIFIDSTYFNQEPSGLTLNEISYSVSQFYDGNITSTQDYHFRGRYAPRDEDLFFVFYPSSPIIFQKMMLPPTEEGAYPVITSWKQHLNETMDFKKEQFLSWLEEQCLYDIDHLFIT